MTSLRFELHTVLDQPVLDEILGLIEDVTEMQGHRPVGEHKYAHLRVGAAGWAGVLARSGDRLVGYAHTRWNPDAGRPRLATEIVVRPGREHDEIAGRLIEQVRDLVGRAGGGAVWLWAHHVEDPHLTLPARMGFSVQRELAFMTRELDAAPPVDMPAGVTLRSYRPDVDDTALLRLNNAAFAGHPENGDWTAETLAERRALDWFDPADLLMAWRGEELVGFHWTKWHGHDSDEVPAHEPVGEVYVLAVDPHAHGSGLGRALLRAGLAHLHGKGCRLAVLYVDGDAAPAVALYRSEGFAVRHHEVCYEDVLPPRRVAPTVDLLRPG